MPIYLYVSEDKVRAYLSVVVEKIFGVLYVHIFLNTIYAVAAPVAARSKAWICGCLVAGIVGSNPAGDMYVSLSRVCCVLSGRGLCDGLITRPEESYRLWCV